MFYVLRVLRVAPLHKSGNVSFILFTAPLLPWFKGMFYVYLMFYVLRYLCFSTVLRYAPFSCFICNQLGVPCVAAGPEINK